MRAMGAVRAQPPDNGRVSFGARTGRVRYERSTNKAAIARPTGEELEELKGEGLDQR
jgi:hypothetical protein